MRQQINLFHPIFRKEAKKFSAVASVQAAAVILVGAVLIYAFELWQLDKLRVERERVHKAEIAAQKRLEQLAQTISAGAGRMDVAGEIARLEAEIASRGQINTLLNQDALGNTAGYSRYLTSFARQYVEGVWLTGVHIAGNRNEMVLKGRSVSPELVPRYIQRLSGEASLAGTEFKVFQMTRPQDEKLKFAPYVEFRAGTSVAEKRETP